ncbi:MAG: hydrogenase expression/formation protein HypE [Acidobacteriota bacterium]
MVRTKLKSKKERTVPLELGSGGKLMRKFLREDILKNFSSKILKRMDDSAIFSINNQIAFTTDSFVVDPIFFPGGDIGRLAVFGTVNDLVVSGAEPKYLSLSLILEEGFPWKILKKILKSIKEASKEAKIEIVTGDTKVVRKGQADGIFINTAGIGNVISKPSPENIKIGDKVILTGNLGEHSIAVLIAREEFHLEGNIKSDCAPLNFLLPLWNSRAKWMRDITRGGLATCLYELTELIPYSIYIYEEKIRLSDFVKGATELLGIDPLYLACEGRAVIIVEEEKSDDVLKYLESNPLGREAEIIGEISERGEKGELLFETLTGGIRLLEPLTYELLPRIC